MKRRAARDAQRDAPMDTGGDACDTQARASPSERATHERDGLRDVTLDDPRGNAQRADADGGEAFITQAIVVTLVHVDRAVDFNDEARGGREEVADVAPENDLPAKAHAERATAKLLPEKMLR